MPLAWDLFVEACQQTKPEFAVVLGSGMADVAGRIRRDTSVAFADIPGLPPSSVAGHRGQLTLGSWAGRRVLLFEGRLHFYEGHGWEAVTRPVRLARELGASAALLTCAVGGIRADLEPGRLMVVRDHFEWNRPYAWQSPGPGGIGTPRESPYSARLATQILNAGQAAGIAVSEGVYAAMTGPCYETPAEVRALGLCGADVVGMSTAREVVAGVEAGLECAALACVANRAAGLSAEPLSHKEVLEVIALAASRVGKVVEGFLGLVS
jgi:purine-nucleoside phosphorylase